jgi:ferredoxin-NADP reductase/hemoglobin-like flavoprotein
MGGGDRSAGTYDRLLALNTAMRLRRTLNRGREPARGSMEEPREDDQRLLKESLDLIAPAVADLVTQFYAVLFRDRPYLRHLFPLAMDTQRDRLLRALLLVVGKLHEPSLLRPLLEQLGRDHRKFGVRPAHYAAVGEALIASLRHYSGTAWRPEFEEAWLRAYGFAVDVMTTAADNAEPAPPYWHATVVGHDLRLDDLAVLTVRPDSPYPYVAGQYATLETAARPRTWRPYSMATAPRTDGLLEFHVRMVGAGWVSRALVRHLSVGDTLRIGPPLGAMTLAAAAPERDVLLVGGGTGAAPMRALLESLPVADPRRVTLVLAARGRSQLYDLDAVCEAVRLRPAVTLIIATEQEEYGEPRGLPGPVAAALTGRADEVLGQLGELREREVFLAGPPGMLAACREAAAKLDIPAEHLHVDVLGE